MKHSIQVFEAAAKLQSTELSAFVGWMNEERDTLMELMSTSKIETVPLLQGKVQMLKEILNLIESARDVLDRKKA